MFPGRAVYLLVDADTVVFNQDMAMCTLVVAQQDADGFSLAVFANIPQGLLDYTQYLYFSVLGKGAGCTVFLQVGADAQNALSILEELLTERGIFQCQIHFSSSQATIWTIDDPLRYRILDQEVLQDPDICLVYPSR